MGALISRIVLAWKTLRQLSALYHTLSKQISLSPGLPLPNPSIPYWVDVPSSIAKHGADAEGIPTSADIIIIGSGITGTAIARTIMDTAKEHDAIPPSIVMLDARDACYGATARNGGHINPPLYHDYPELKQRYGQSEAIKMIRFRLSHLPEILAVAEQEGLTEQSQCRRVDAFNVYYDLNLFSAAKQKLGIYSKDLPEESATFRIIEDPQILQDMQLSKLAVGCIANVAGAIHPYRFVTGVLARLLREYESSFHLFTNTACLAIDRDPANGTYDIKTPKGLIRAKHVVHATNAWSSHLLPGMREKIVPARGEMAAQRPGESLSAAWAGTRSFTFFPGKIDEQFDYLTQLPPQSGGEMMFGGVFTQDGVAEAPVFDAIGNTDDSGFNFSVVSTLAGALGLYFEGHWGKESRDANSDDPRWENGRIKAHWTGILGFSADGMPWVGRIPDKISQRPVSHLHREETASPATTLCLSDPGEWICSGFTGEGMTHAWMSGMAVAHMMLQYPTTPHLQKVNTDVQDWEKWLPDPYLIREKRWKEADIASLLVVCFSSLQTE